MTERLAWRVAELVARRAETPSVATVEFEVAGWMHQRAGDHVDVRLTTEDGYQAKRSYSIASAPGDGRVALTVAREDGGEVSPYLVDEMRPGDVLELRGPIGGWFAWEVARGGPLLLVGGGSGVVPLMAILRHRAAAHSDVPARLLLSARTAEDVIYANELRSLASGDSSLLVTVTLTRGTPAGWDGPSGRVDREMLERYGWSAAERPRVFVCGPTPFVEAAATALVDSGHDPRQIRTERFGS